MRASQQWNKLFIANLSLFWGTVCIYRPSLRKDKDQNVLPVIFQYSRQTQTTCHFWARWHRKELYTSILKLLSSTSIQGFLLRYITFSYVIWLKNDRLSEFDENIWIWLVKHFDLYPFLKLVYICILYLKIKIDLQQITDLIVAKLSFLHTL